jgi:hypothetical protein
MKRNHSSISKIVLGNINDINLHEKPLDERIKENNTNSLKKNNMDK